MARRRTDNRRWGLAGLRRDTVKIAADGAAWAIALTFAAAARLDFRLGSIRLTGLVAIVAIAIAGQWFVGRLTGLYTGRWRFGSFEEAAAIMRTAVFVTLIAMVVDTLSSDYLLPRSAVIAGGVAAIVGMGGIRYAYRMSNERQRRPSSSECERLLVFGAGEGAYQAIRAMVSDPDSPYVPIGILDDDPRKQRLRLHGVPVLGTRDDLARVANATDADGVLVAIPSAGSSVISELTELVDATGLPAMVLPPVGQLFGMPVKVDDIREVTPADLLGRGQVETDLESIIQYVTGKRVLVTGAGGSIGSELCRQLYKYAPAELVMLDRDESALHGVQFSLEGQALLDSPSLVLLDIRDRGGVARLFERLRPEVVFHAAALKHLPLLERHPGEAVKTNVWGTLALLDAAAEFGTERFINISTDKAADPISVLGFTKRVCERLTAQVAAETGRRYVSVRFGNVLGSRGSMLPTFQAQIEAAAPVTVTDPGASRYFMTIEEAVELVIQAGAIGQPGEALVLDMGEPVPIVDVVRLLSRRAHQPTRITFTGLRPGEKLEEALLAADEIGTRPVHPLIQHVTVPPLPTESVQALNPAGDPKECINLLHSLCLPAAAFDRSTT